MKTRSKRIQKGKEGLLHGPLRIEVEDVTTRHKKECAGCAGIPAGRRLKIVSGGGRSAQTSIYCSECGDEWLIDHSGDVTRARTRLVCGSDVCVRLTED